MTDDLYGLCGRPFGQEVDTAFYFEGKSQDAALAHLAYRLAQGDACVAVIGDAGLGKSMLGAHLAATIEPERLTVALVAADQFADRHPVAAVARVFALPGGGEDAGAARHELETLLHQAARAGRRCLLVIDDAHSLSVSTFDALADLAAIRLGGQPLLETILLGRPTLCEAIGRRAINCPIRAGVTQAHRLAPIAAHEVRGYVEHRLESVGWRGNPAWMPDLFDPIHAASGGVPSDINRVCERLMLLGARDQHAGLDRAMLDAVLDDLSIEARVAPPTVPADSLDTIIATHDAQIAALDARLAILEARQRDQEQALRLALTVLVEWAEGDLGRRYAA